MIGYYEIKNSKRITLIIKRDICGTKLVNRQLSKAGRSTKIDDIPIPQFSLVRNAVADDLIDRSSITLGVILTGSKDIAYVQTDFGNLR